MRFFSVRSQQKCGGELLSTEVAVEVGFCVNLRFVPIQNLLGDKFLFAVVLHARELKVIFCYFPAQKFLIILVSFVAVLPQISSQCKLGVTQLAFIPLLPMRLHVHFHLAPRNSFLAYLALDLRLHGRLVHHAVVLVQDLEHQDKKYANIVDRESGLNWIMNNLPMLNKAK